MTAIVLVISGPSIGELFPAHGEVLALEYARGGCPNHLYNALVLLRNSDNTLQNIINYSSKSIQYIKPNFLPIHIDTLLNELLSSTTITKHIKNENTTSAQINCAK